MRIENRHVIQSFQEKHANSRRPLDRWMTLVDSASWKKVLDVQATFASAEDIEGFIVFNIGGNNFRLIGVIDYSEQTIYIHHVYTHQQYDRWSP